MKRAIKGIKLNKYDEYEVRLNYLGKRYSVINYTKKYNCNTLEEVESKIKELKEQIDKGEEPLSRKKFGEYFDEYFKKLAKKGTASSYNYNKMYDKYAKSHLHDLLVAKLEKKHIDYIYEDMIDYRDDNGKYTINSKQSLKKMKTILSPTFKLLHKLNKIDRNYLEIVEIPELDRHTELASLSFRLKDQNYTEVVQKLYKSIQNLKDENSRMYLLFTLMTMRRKEETFKITKNHITNDVVYVSKGMTKTNIDERFIIPDELQEYMTSNQNEYVLKCGVHKYLDDWQIVLKDAGIDYFQKFRVYDTRHLFMSIMSKKYNRELVGACISHYKGDTNEKYSSYEFADRKDIMKIWWDILRKKT